MRRGEYFQPDWEFYQALKLLGYQKIIGIDEVGRGALAGPVVVAAVEINEKLEGVHDSKLVSEKKRSGLEQDIRRLAKQVNLGQASHDEIDKLGMSRALALAYSRALEGLEFDLILTDYYQPGTLPYLSTKKGDQFFYPTAAASIVAKVYRDNLMKDLHKKFPAYDWENNVGYGTANHLKMIRENGPCPWHRRSFLV